MYSLRDKLDDLLNLLNGVFPDNSEHYLRYFRARNFGEIEKYHFCEALFGRRNIDKQFPGRV